jgi:excisionase family DNA binding protein
MFTPCRPDADLKLAFRIDEAVAASGLSRSTLYNLIAAGTLPSVRVAGRRLILKADLVKLLSGGVPK